MTAMAFAATEAGVPPGTVVVLNGTSSAGKTGIARELQTLLDEPYFSLGIDYFFGMLQLRYWAEADARVVSGMHQLHGDSRLTRQQRDPRLGGVR
jgi:chloramphenicol 3-O-phosphotransferase